MTDIPYVPFEVGLAEAPGGPAAYAEWVATAPERSFSDEVLRYRGAAGLTQAGLAHKLGIWSSQISKIEAAETKPTITMLRKFCAALGITCAITIQPDGNYQMSFSTDGEVPADAGRDASAGVP